MCEENGAPAEARAELERGLALSPSHEKLRSELAKLEGKEEKPAEAFAKLHESERKKAYEKCGELLADLAEQDDRAGQADRFERHAALLLEHFPRDDLLERLGVVWFEPYLKLVKTADAKLLEAGGELVDGKRLERDAVSALDSQHASWARPWVVSDAVHEVRTTLPLRTARRLLAHVGAFRAFFLSQLQSAWELKPPRNKLVVVATGTQADFRARLKAECEKAKVNEVSGPPGAAYYLHMRELPGPCVVTFEPTFADQPAEKIGFEGVLFALRHELTHQIAFEYSRFAANRTRTVRHQAWCVEGLAGYMEEFEVDRGRFRLAKRKRIKLGGPEREGAFAWCVRNRSKLPPLERVFSLPRDQLASEDFYDVSATIALFLMEGEGRRYRKPFLKLLETVHRARDDEKTFDACFPLVEKKALQEEWLKFVGEIRLDDER
ncbi:hypothetical protein HY251_11905 [bacterium]|nr:hypothetical protein [bacterium]